MLDAERGVSINQYYDRRFRIQVAGISNGKEKKTMANISHRTEMMLTVIPVNWFIENGPFCMVLRNSKTLVRMGTR